MSQRIRGGWGISLAVILLLSAVGCVNMVSHLMYAVYGDKVPAEYEGLKEKKVAVVVISDSSPYQDDVATSMLARLIEEQLADEVEKLEIIDEQEVTKWRDSNGWDNSDFVALGRGVKADQVIVVELVGLKLREGATMYRGRAQVTTSVYDIATGKRPFRRHLEDFTYPVSAGQFTTETTEARFRRTFITVLSQRIARYFFPYDYKDTFALDAAIVNS